MGALWDCFTFLHTKLPATRQQELETNSKQNCIERQAAVNPYKIRKDESKSKLNYESMLIISILII
jgi:hypothetical protein